MKAVTANRLTDGAVVYLDGAKAWTESLTEAALFEDEAADAVLTDAEVRETEIVGAYLIDAEPGGVASGQKHLRESIRAAGPTVNLEFNTRGLPGAR